MNPQATRTFIEQVINAPSIAAAQWLVETNAQMLDATFYQVLQSMALETQAQIQSATSMYMPNMPGFVVDQLINQQEQLNQRLQALQMLNQYAITRAQAGAGAVNPTPTPASWQISCPNCGNHQVLSCPGFGQHPPAASLVASATGVSCTLCQAQFNSFTCTCGAVIPLVPNAPDTEPHAQPEPPQRQTPDTNEQARLFELLKQRFEEEKDKGDMDAARQSGLAGVMERLGKLVDGSDSERSLHDMVADQGKLNELMADMLHRLKKPTYSGALPDEETRAGRVFALLNELKVYVASESMRAQKSDGETDKLMELFQRLGSLIALVQQAQNDEQQLVRLEQDQARSLSNEVRLFARRHCLTLARPIWPHGEARRNPNLLFYCGPDASRAALQRVASRLELEINPQSRTGADVDESRWHDLRLASLAVFDISATDPQVFYELGIALTLGTELLLIARRGTQIPFDVAQNVRHYEDLHDLQHILSQELDGVLYGLQTPASTDRSLQGTVAYAERLAAQAGDEGLLHVALDNLRQLGDDPIRLHSACKLLNTYLGNHQQSLLYPRWPGKYPDPQAPRCFIIMPFRAELSAIHSTIERLCHSAYIEPVRGDAAHGQEIISSIWTEISRATHITVDLTGFNPNVCLELGIADTLGRDTLLIARQGTAEQLAGRFPSIAKRRCHTYPEDSTNADNDAAFVEQLQSFLQQREGGVAK